MAQCSIYIDLEYDHKNRIIEFAGVVIDPDMRFIFQELHHFVKYLDNSPSTKYLKTAENSHCISKDTLELYGIGLIELQHEFNKLIDNCIRHYKAPIIKGHGSDITYEYLCKHFKFLSRYNDIMYAQVGLPNWVERQYLESHIAAFNMKTNTMDISCNPNNHSVRFRPRCKDTSIVPTHSQLARTNYGHHCALVDCYEMAFYEKTIPNYCCDTHFLEIYVFRPKPPSPYHLRLLDENLQEDVRSQYSVE